MTDGNFKNWGDANNYCKRFDAAHLVRPLDKFDLAEALLRAYKAGAAEQASAPDGSTLGECPMCGTNLFCPCQGVRT